MSDIKVGDLVVVVRGAPCCGNTQHLGLVFRVAVIFPLEGHCNHCGEEPPPQYGADYELESDSGFSLSTLKRIPPLSELEGERTQEDIREPA